MRGNENNINHKKRGTSSTTTTTSTSTTMPAMWLTMGCKTNVDMGCFSVDPFILHRPFVNPCRVGVGVLWGEREGGREGGW